MIAAAQLLRRGIGHRPEENVGLGELQSCAVAYFDRGRPKSITL